MLLNRFKHKKVEKCYIEVANYPVKNKAATAV